MTTVFLLATGAGNSYTFPSGITSITATGIAGGAGGAHAGSPSHNNGGGGGGCRAGVSLSSSYAGHSYSYRVGAAGAARTCFWPRLRPIHGWRTAHRRYNLGRHRRPATERSCRKLNDEFRRPWLTVVHDGEFDDVWNAIR